MGTMKSLRPLLAALLLLCLALPAQAAPPAFESETPLDLNGLRLLMTEAELEKQVGPPQREVDDQMRLYAHNLVARVREGQVANLMVSGEDWKLGQGGAELACTGQAESSLRASFGSPSGVYARKDKPLQTLLYTSRWADLGVMVHQGLVVGLMLAEPGYMEGSLMDSGWVLQAP